MSSFKLHKISILKGDMTSNKEGSLNDLIRQLFNKRDYSSKTALLHNGKSINCSELHILVNCISALILKNVDISDMKNDEPIIIGFLLSPSFERIASMLSVIQLGMAYVSFDHSIPVKRARMMLKETNCSLLLTTDVATCEIIELCSELNITVANCGSCKDVSLRPEMVKSLQEKQHDENPLVCVLYTSGSTATPKGVKLHASAIINRLCWYWRTFPFGLNERCCHKTSLLFVDSLTEILSAVLQLIPLEIFDREVVQNVELFTSKLHEAKITRLVTVPSMLNAIASMTSTKEIGKPLQYLTHIICSGEALSNSLVGRILNLASETSKVLNFYGSTETAGDVTFNVFTSVEGDPNKCACLGRPVDNCNVYILDDQMRLVANGVVGEICISGLNLARGYVTKDASIETSRSQFIANMFSKEDGYQTLYRMGDLGKVVGGRLYFEGRLDSQVKIRGQRVNLVEIEKVVQQVEGVEKVVVVCCELDQQSSSPWTYANKIIVAFVKLNEYAAKDDPSDIILSHCTLILPAYMVPRVHILSAFPLQQNTGKIDRQALKQIGIMEDHVKEIEIDGPISVQDTVLQVLSRNIGKLSADINCNNSFFEEGGSSLGAVNVVNQLAERGCIISLTQFMNMKNIDGLIDYFINADEQQNHTIMTPEIKPHKIYQVELLHKAPDQDDAVDIIAQGFAERNPLDILAKTGKLRIVSLVKSIWKDVLGDKLSLLVRDTRNEKIVAASLLCDLRTELYPVFEMTCVGDINEEVEAPVKQRLLKEGGRWVDSALLAVSDDISDGTSLEIVKLMELHSEKMLASMGYGGIITVNSHPVTAMIAEKDLHYSTENSIHVKSWIDKEGCTPFSEANSDYYIHCMCKRLK